MQKHNKNRDQQQHGGDQGQLPNRNRSDVQETPEQDISTQPRRPGRPNENVETDNEQKGGDRSDRAAVSGATGERSSSGGQNKPQPKNQDEKGMGHPRNR